MRQFWLICIFLFGSFISEGQDAQRADSLFEAGNFSESAIYFERVAFGSNERHASAAALSKKAICYKALGDFEKSMDVLKRISVSGLSDSFKIQVSFEKMTVNYLLDKYEESYREVLKHRLLYGESPDLLRMEILDLLALNKWVEAKKIVLINAELFHLSEEDINEIFPKKLKPKNPDKAFNLSFFLPGVGQMYAGYPIKGIVSGGIQAVLVAFSAYNLYNGYFFTGGMTGVAFFYTFYFGGAKYASELAVKNNQQKSAIISAKFNKKALN
jgi:tetratricopeptide (TPR) repeat protein